MFIKQFLTGGDRNYGYLVADDETQRAAIIDPSYSPKRIVDLTQDKGYTIEYIFSTHDHYDHTFIDQDPQVLLPLRHLEDMVTEGIIGELAPTVVSFMGYQPDVTRVLDELIPAIQQAIAAQSPQAALVVPA